MMRKTYKALTAALMATTVLAGCQNEDPINQVVEGLPVSISFNVEVPNMDNIVVTRATDEQETRIEKMAILFYNANQENSKPIVVKVDDLGDPTQRTTTNYLYTINLDEEQLDGVYSGTWYMYPIANYDKYTVVNIDDLAGKTRKEFKEYTITASGRDITSTAVMMSGNYGTKETIITLQPGENTFDNVFHLRRIVSKNIFKFVNGTGVTFTPQKYSIYNYSTSSTLLERDELNEYAGVNTGTGKDGFTDFESLPITNNDGSFSFYMPENVQIPNAKASWAYADREKRNADDYNTFTYAPANATYVVVEGTYSGPGEGTNQATGNVKYTIHLGDFGDSKGAGSFDNFTVKRNAKYTYTVTVNGVNSIIVEAKSETGEEPNPGAEGQIVGPDPHVTVNLDAHYENVLLSFSSGISSFSISATTPDESGNMQSFIDASNNKSEHIDAVSWVKFGKPASTTTFANYPQNDDVVDIYTLIAEIKGRNYNHCILSNGKIYVQAFVDEYFYDDRNYSTFVNKADRSLSFTLGTASISKDEHSSYIEGEGFTLQQKSIKTFYADNVGNPFGFETVEETPNAAFGAMGVEDTFSGNDYQNGRNDTWSNISSASTAWGTIVNIPENGHIGDADVTSSSVMQSDYTNPLYQCLSRNRDLNGDGTITKDEIKWYVPSFRQYIYTWCGIKALTNDISFSSNEIYASSSNAGYRIWWAKEGVAIGSYSAGGTYSGTTYQPQSPSVRCVRNLGESIDDNFSEISSYKEDTRVVTITGLKNEALRTNEQSGEYPEHINTDAASTLPKAFKIAKDNLETEVEVSGDVTISVTTNYSTYGGQVSNLVDNDKSSYWWSGEAQASGKYVQLAFSVPVKVASVQVYASNRKSNNSVNNDYPKNQTLQISEDGQNWTDIGTVNSRDVTVTNSVSPDMSVQYVRLYQNSSSGNWLYLNEITVNYTTISGQTITKNTFSYNELMSGDWCEKYYSEEGDADKGKWRIPNEKELYFIQLYCSGDFNLMTTNGDGGDLVGAKTKYYRGSVSAEYMIYYLRNDASAKTPIITTGETVGVAYKFKLRCVRDATPETKSYDSSYGDGGTGFGL